MAKTYAVVRSYNDGNRTSKELQRYFDEGYEFVR